MALARALSCLNTLVKELAMLKRFFLIGFLNDECTHCKGAGFHKYPALRPVVCETCDGTGKNANPLATIAWIVVILVLTFGPVIWYFN